MAHFTRSRDCAIASRNILRLLIVITMIWRFGIKDNQSDVEFSDDAEGSKIPILKIGIFDVEFVPWPITHNIAIFSLARWK